MRMLLFALAIIARISERERSGPTINRRVIGRRCGSPLPAESARNSVSRPLTTDGSCVINIASHVRVKHLLVGFKVVMIAVAPSATRYLAWYFTTGSA